MSRNQSGDNQKGRLIGGLFWVLLLAACGSGSGGGGSSSSNGSNTLDYTGIASQAAVTASNADELSAGAILNTGAGASASLVGVTGHETSAPAKARSVTASMAVKRALGRLDHTAGSALAGAMVTVSDVMPGTCPGNPGSASYNISVDDVTGDFSGTISFQGYCDDGDTLTGGASFSGNIDPITDAFTALSVSTSSLMVVSGADSFTIAGSLAFTAITSVSENLSMTLNIRNDTGKVYRIENFLCVLMYDSPSLGTDSVRLVSGRFYHPDYGYVEVASASDFQFSGAADYPYAGVLVATGSSKARLTANSDGQTFEVKADTDGNGTYETGPTVYRWDSM